MRRILLIAAAALLMTGCEPQQSQNDRIISEAGKCQTAGFDFEIVKSIGSYSAVCKAPELTPVQNLELYLMYAKKREQERTGE